VSATRSSISVIITRLSISLLMVVIERGVSTTVLPRPKTESSASVGITLTRSPSTTTVSSTDESLAAYSSEGEEPAAVPSDRVQIARTIRASDERCIEFFPNF
jgi:hypothetical protein